MNPSFLIHLYMTQIFTFVIGRRPFHTVVVQRILLERPLASEVRFVSPQAHLAYVVAALRASGTVIFDSCVRDTRVVLQALDVVICAGASILLRAFADTCHTPT